MAIKKEILDELLKRTRCERGARAAQCQGGGDRGVAEDGNVRRVAAVVDAPEHAAYMSVLALISLVAVYLASDKYRVEIARI